MISEVIRARARFTGDNTRSTYYENNSFHNLKIKQDGWKIKIIVEGDTTKASLTEYDTLADFFDVWNIYCILTIGNRWKT